MERRRVYLLADSESPHMTWVKNASLRSYDQKMYWSRDQLVNRIFRSLDGLG